MFKIVVIKRLLFRKLLPLFLVTYLVAIVFFIVSVDQTDLAYRAIDSGLPSGQDFPNIDFLANNTIASFSFKDRGDSLPPISLVRTAQYGMVITNRSPGDFIVLGREAFVYSAYVDDRSNQTFIRILAIFSKNAAHFHGVYCHFNETFLSAPRKALRYELCENHEKRYGGYFYSCPVPNAINVDGFHTVLVSLSKFGPRVSIPLSKLRPPQHKLGYLNRYPEERATLRVNQASRSVPSSSQQSNTSPPKDLSNQLSFAICVSPLFGPISVFRLIEFIELSKLLGANHIYFYNYSIHEPIESVLQFYARQNQITVLPWKLPSEVEDTLVWYHGQLLSNNDCLYRTMSSHDLVSFNDLDEFIVPHSNATTWNESFGLFLQDDQCGYSFQSAFYDPGNIDSYEPKLITPVSTTRTLKMSQVRTKVMVCPWRIFEVGIHHVSKQNKEEWRPFHIDPSLAYLHHYRRCSSDFSMDCYTNDNDNTVADRYGKSLTRNFESVLKTLYEQNILKNNYS